MLMFANFFEFALEVSAIFTVTPLDREGGFAEVVAQVGVAGASEAGFFGLKFSRTRLAPLEPGELGDLGFVAVKTFHTANLSHDASGQNQSKTWDGCERVGNILHLLGNSCLQASRLLMFFRLRLKTRLTAGCKGSGRG